MASHFDAVGFSAGREEFGELLSAAWSRAVSSNAVVEHSSGSTASYRDPSGALLTIHLNERNELACAQPSFDSELRARWRPESIVPDESCVFCDLVYAELLDADGEMVYPIATHVESIGANRELIPFGEPGEVRIVGLCESGEVWPDESAFLAAQSGFSAQSFVPSGTFGDGAMSAHAIAHGIVTSVEERRNELCGGRSSSRGSTRTAACSTPAGGPQTRVGWPPARWRGRASG